MKQSKKHNPLKIFLGIIVTVILLIGGLYGARKYRRHSRLLQQIAWQTGEKEKEQARQFKIRHNFIKKIGPIAEKVDKSYDLLPSITIAQACLESEYGQSDLAKKYNNLFGVKGTNPHTTVTLQTKEHVNGKWKTVNAKFQIYDSYEASIRAHARLFQKGTSFNSKQYKHVLAAKNYKKQAKALVQDGYATDPNYSKKLTDLIEQYNLQNYDKDEKTTVRSK